MQWVVQTHDAQIGQPIQMQQAEAREFNNSRIFRVFSHIIWLWFRPHSNSIQHRKFKSLRGSFWDTNRTLFCSRRNRSISSFYKSNRLLLKGILILKKEKKIFRMAGCYSTLAVFPCECAGIFLHCARTWTYRLAHEKFQFTFYVWHSFSSTNFFLLCISHWHMHMSFGLDWKQYQLVRVNYVLVRARVSALLLLLWSALVP